MALDWLTLAPAERADILINFRTFRGRRLTLPVGELVSIIGQFSGASGRFMYYCQVLEHEDAGTMSTFVVMPNEVMDIDPHLGGDPHHRIPRQTTLWDDHLRYLSPHSDAALPDESR